MEGGESGGRREWREERVEEGESGGGESGGRREWRKEGVEGGGSGGRREWRKVGESRDKVEEKGSGMDGEKERERMWDGGRKGRGQYIRSASTFKFIHD